MIAISSAPVIWIIEFPPEIPGRPKPKFTLLKPNYMHNNNEMSIQELTREKSTQQAYIISHINHLVHSIDPVFLREAASANLVEADNRDSAAVFNLNYDPTMSCLLRAQATAITKICEYIDLLEQVQELKLKLGIKNMEAKKAGNLFGY